MGLGELGLTMKVIRGLEKMKKWVKYTKAGRGWLRVPVDELNGENKTIILIISFLDVEAMWVNGFLCNWTLHVTII